MSTTINYTTYLKNLELIIRRVLKKKVIMIKKVFSQTEVIHIYTENDRGYY